jgi:predicted  nucleic acid-binding Zn-ribbon protein
MGMLDDLLTVQGHDTAVDGLRRRRERLPVRAELAAALADLRTVDGELTAVRGERDAVARKEKALDDEARTLEAKAADVEKRLYSGTVSSPRELQAMQADVDSLRRHRREVEDRELEVLVEREGLDEQLAGLEARHAEAEARRAEHQATLDAQESAIDGELASETSARAALAGTLPADVLALYEKIRAKENGVGAGKLVGSQCQGCHLTLPAMEVAAARKAPPDEVFVSATCGHILVR